MTRQPTPSILDAVLATDATGPATIRNDAIKVDGGTQMRAQLDAATVAEYADTMTASGWGAFPPIIAYYDGSDYWIADGFHRLAAWRSLADFSDALIPADVRSGTRRDAILHAAGANASHGLRRTNADKRRAVETLLRDQEWAAWSDHEIARRCAVSQPFVSGVREKLTNNGYQSPTVRKGADGRTINTENIGAKPGPAVPPIPTPTAKEYSAAVQAAQPARGDGVGDIVKQWEEAGSWTLAELVQHVQAFAAEFWTEPHEFSSIHLNLSAMAGKLITQGERAQLWGALSERLKGRPWQINGMITALRRVEGEYRRISKTPDPAVAANAAAATVQIIEYDADAPLPAWAQEEPAPRIRGYSVLDDYALRDMQPASPANAYAPLAVPDGRIPAARHLITLYRTVIEAEDQYGSLTSLFSDYLAVKRDLTAMIGRLEHLIAAIEHPEEVSE